MIFTGTQAREWAEQGKLAEWVQNFLRDDTGAHANLNPGFANGLLLEDRFYIGPVQLPLDHLKTVRVAEDISDVRELMEFRRKVEAIIRLLPEWDMPPFLVQYRDGALWLTDGNHRYTALWLTDGNHRYTALAESGSKTGCAIIWGAACFESEAMEYLKAISAD